MPEFLNYWTVSCCLFLNKDDCSIVIENFLKTLLTFLLWTLFPLLGNEVANEAEEVAVRLGASQLEFALGQLETLVELGIVFHLWSLAEDDYLFQMEELGEEEDGVAHLVEVDEAALVVDV